MSKLIFEQSRNEGCLAYFLADELSREAALIDPKKEDRGRYLSRLRETGWRLKYVIDTHIHADHISDSCEIARIMNAQVVMSEKTTSQRLELSVREGSVLRLGERSLRFIETPGHAPDGVSIAADSYLLTGDSLLLDDCGRTDFPGGSSGVMYETLQRILREFPDETVIAPAHDYDGRTVLTLGQVKESNAALRFRTKQEFVDYLASWNLTLPQRLKESLMVNRQNCFKLGS